MFSLPAYLLNVTGRITACWLIKLNLCNVEFRVYHSFQASTIHSVQNNNVYRHNKSKDVDTSDYIPLNLICGAFLNAIISSPEHIFSPQCCIILVPGHCLSLFTLVILGQSRSIHPYLICSETFQILSMGKRRSIYIFYKDFDAELCSFIFCIKKLVIAIEICNF